MNKQARSLGAVIAAIAAIVATASPFKFGRAVDPVKVTVEGEGYLRLSREGRTVYSKSAVLTIGEGGKIATPKGDTLLPSITAPSGLEKLWFDLEGNAYSVRGESKAKIGRVVLALFPEGSALSEKDGVLLAIDRPRLANPGEGTTGVIRSESQVAKAAVKSPAKPTEIVSAANSAIKIEPAPKNPLPGLHPDGGKPALAGPIGKPLPTNGSWRIVASPNAEVESDKVLLGDIASIEADEAALPALKLIEIGDTPALGAKRAFDRTRIMAKLRGAGFDAAKFELIVPASVQVTRKAQAIPHAQFNEAALKAVYESAGIATEYAPADTNGPDFPAPSGKFALVAEAITGINTPIAAVKVAVYVGTTRVNSRTIKLTAKAAPAIVKAGSNVKVLFRAGGTTVEVPGIARTSGKPGDLISVEVRVAGAQEKTLHSGTLLANGSVEVKL